MAAKRLGCPLTGSLRSAVDEASLAAYNPSVPQFPPDLQPVIENLKAAERQLQVVVSRMPPTCWSESSPNADWNYKDLMAHLATGDWVRQHFLTGLLETGRILDWPDADAGNSERITARREKPVSTLTKERAEHRRRTIELIERLQPEHLAQAIDMPGLNAYGVPFLRYLQGFPAHDINHTRELQAIVDK